MDHLVYIKQHSITHELIDDFLELYETEQEENDEEDNQDILMIHPNAQKFRSFLMNEIQKENIHYFNKMNNHFGEKTLLYSWRNNISSFIVKTEHTFSSSGTSNKIETVQKTVEKFQKKEVKMFCFLWFLHDSPDQYVFPNGQIITHTKGTLLIIPYSSFFPFYVEKSSFQEKCLNITGYVYINDGIH